MSADAQKVRSIFLAAVENHTPEQWGVYLDDACGGDADLRHQVELLLRAHQQANSLFDAPPLPTTLGEPVSEAPGTAIGPYKLVEVIGEGGMGTVYLAQQTAPVKRLVALKVIKAGMDSRQVLARFEAERQALALMDHPNIARVLDAAATPAGRPYFVMELVKGVPITKYCDEHCLLPKDRLELFVQVCQAVQHAHQKGIIHRDLKPSNVLVAPYDGRPVVKVIDFGVAKAAGVPLTDKTLVTGLGAVVGTLEYMSPEQAELNNQDVDTRSDIYCLGILLYELLTGTTPLTRGRLKDAAFVEMLRLIREEEPPKPSTRLSDSAGSLPSISAQRHMEPAKLTRLVRGELDWIVMKALEKDRARRYETATGFAADVQRYLADEAVLACPPSAGYRLRKALRRHKRPVLAAGLVVLALLSGVVGTTIGLVREAEQRRRAESNEQKALAAAAAEKIAKDRAEANEKTAKAREADTQAVLDFVTKKVFAAARPAWKAGGLGHDVTLRQAIDAAVPFVEGTFTNQPFIEAHLRATLGVSFVYLGEAARAKEQFEKARPLYTKCLGPEHRLTLGNTVNLALSYYDLGRYSDAVKLDEEALPVLRARFPDHENTVLCMNGLANCYGQLGRHPDALNLREEALAQAKAKLGPDHPITLVCMTNLALSYYTFGRNADGLKLSEETLKLRKAKIGPDHPDTYVSMDGVAHGYSKFGRYAEALKLCEESLDLAKAKFGPGHSVTLQRMDRLALNYQYLGRHAEVLKLREEALALNKARLGPDHPDTLRSMHRLAGGYRDLGRHAEALKLREETLALQKAKLGPDHPDTLMSMWGLAETLVQLDRDQEAGPIIDECVRRATGKAVQPNMIPSVIGLRVRRFEKTKDAAGCRAVAEMLERLKPTDADSLYSAACIRAITAAVIRAGDDSETAVKQATVEADRAMAWLQKAVGAGFKDVMQMKQDKDLDALRGREDFKKLVAALDAKK